MFSALSKVAVDLAQRECKDHTPGRQPEQVTFPQVGEWTHRVWAKLTNGLPTIAASETRWRMPAT
jgi:hypothetical protein